jgi:pyruvate,water dikinase
MLCHAAIDAREIGIPCVVGTKKATTILKEGMPVIVDGTKGVVYGRGIPSCRYDHVVEVAVS